MRKFPRVRVTAGVSRSVRPVKRAKRRVCEKEDTDVCADDLNAMRVIGNKVRKFIFTDKVTKVASEFLLRCVAEYEEQMMRMIAKNEKLNGRIEECEKSLAQRSANVVIGTGVSYASMASKGAVKTAGSSQASASECVRDKTYAVVVKAKDDSVKITSEEVKEKVMKNVNSDLKISVRAVRKTRSGGLAIEAASERDIRMLRECKKFGALGLKVEDPKKIGPKVLLFDLENEMTNEDLLNEVYEKNLRNAGVSEKEFKERVRVVSRMNRKVVNVGNVIIEVSNRMREILVREGRVYVKWRACKVRESVNVLRCHKCFAFGHMMKECSVEGRLCERCGESVICRFCPRIARSM